MELQTIQNKIHEIRGQKVMLDFDLAEMYGTETAQLTICQSDPVGSQEREIHISTTGAATVKKTTAGSCS